MLGRQGVARLANDLGRKAGCTTQPPAILTKARSGLEAESKRASAAHWAGLGHMVKEFASLPIQLGRQHCQGTLRSNARLSCRNARLACHLAALPAQRMSMRLFHSTKLFHSSREASMPAPLLPLAAAYAVAKVWLLKPAGVLLKSASTGNMLRLARTGNMIRWRTQRSCICAFRLHIAANFSASMTLRSFMCLTSYLMLLLL